MKPRGIVVTAALGALLGLPGIAQAADLVSCSVSVQRYGHPGGELLANSKVRARSSVRSVSQLRFYLSKDTTRDASDTLLAGTVRVPKLKKGRSYKASAVVAIPSTTAASDYYVIACADDLGRVRESNEKNNCAAARTRTSITTDQKTSRSLIKAAGLPPEQALLYRVYAAFGDPRLPSRFR